MLPGQGQVVQGGRTNFPEGHQEGEPWGKGQGRGHDAGAIGSL
jgi:hypothetical protein